MEAPHRQKKRLSSSSTRETVDQEAVQSRREQSSAFGATRRYPIGTKVRGHFVGDGGWCTGEVISHDRGGCYGIVWLKTSNKCVEKGVPQSELVELAKKYKRYIKSGERREEKSSLERRQSIFDTICPDEENLTAEEKAFLKAFASPEFVASHAVPDANVSSDANAATARGSASTEAMAQPNPDTVNSTEFNAAEDGEHAAYSKNISNTQVELEVEYENHRKRLEAAHEVMLRIHQKWEAHRSQAKSLHCDILGFQASLNRSLGYSFEKRDAVRGFELYEDESTAKKQKQTCLDGSLSLSP